MARSIALIFFVLALAQSGARTADLGAAGPLPTTGASGPVEWTAGDSLDLVVVAGAFFAVSRVLARRDTRVRG
jgi:hypothetical protein